jgi:rRNA small subunit pseudouridine methyltransferase Nep1
MLHLLLVETALEIAPSKYRGHPSVLNNAKKYGNPGRILDMALHHSFMKNLKDNSKRGRPDILHQYLITCLTSILNKQNHLRMYFHTYEGEIYEINPIMRPPKDFMRYKGLMYKLLTEKEISTDKSSSHRKNAQLSESLDDSTLIRKIHLPLPGFIKQINPDRVLRFTSQGTLCPRNELFSFMKDNPKENVLAIVGGFQSGGFSSTIMDIDAEDISIYPEGIETNTVINHIIINFEQNIGI